MKQLFWPKNLVQGLCPGVIVIPGSDGGVPVKIAERLATKGFAALALGYVNSDGHPSHLENIPLEYFKNAIDELKAHPRISQVFILGYSRGAELALLLGSYFPGLMDGIIAFEPSSVAWGSFPSINKPSWLFQNKPIPYQRALMSSAENLTEKDDLLAAIASGAIPMHANTEEDPFILTELFNVRLKKLEPDAVIPVERIACPLLIFSGGRDSIWPSQHFAEQITQRLVAHKSTIKHVSIVYPEAGHSIIAPYDKAIYHPIGQFWCLLGGSPEANTAASKDAWQKTVQFLVEESNPEL